MLILSLCCASIWLPLCHYTVHRSRCQRDAEPLRRFKSACCRCLKTTQTRLSLQDIIRVGIHQRAFIFKDRLPRRCVGLARTTGTQHARWGVSCLYSVTTTTLMLFANRCVRKQPWKATWRTSGWDDLTSINFIHNQSYF